MCVVVKIVSIHSLYLYKTEDYMNRIILIGNGFDLAHGLPTSYTSFICDIWEDFQTKAIGAMSREFENEFFTFKTDIYTLAHIISNMPNPNSQYSLNRLEEQIKRFKSGSGATVNLTFKNKFLETISRHSDSKNWVDIENEYYKFLRRLLNRDNKKLFGDDYIYTNISKLNEDFLSVRILLESYLQKVIANSKILRNDNIENHIYSEFKLKDFTKNGFDNIIETEYQKIQNYKKDNNYTLGLSPITIRVIDSYKDMDLDSFKKELVKQYVASNHFLLVPNNILFLNFNYTNTEKQYLNFNLQNQEIIHIHGELNNKKNPIIFGYGDEIDDEYKEIEKTTNNEFLENIKSIKYHETDNYKKTLNFLESDKYQIFIFGHSCGNSDRTLLNTLFEHENCVSIKPFYHKKSDTEDNYSDIVRNISRNFTNKPSMREKVVNKMYCEPLT